MEIDSGGKWNQILTSIKSIKRASNQFLKLLLTQFKTIKFLKLTHYCTKQYQEQVEIMPNSGGLIFRLGILKRKKKVNFS